MVPVAELGPDCLVPVCTQCVSLFLSLQAAWLNLPLDSSFMHKHDCANIPTSQGFMTHFEKEELDDQGISSSSRAVDSILCDVL